MRLRANIRNDSRLKNKMMEKKLSVFEIICSVFSLSLSLSLSLSPSLSLTHIQPHISLYLTHVLIICEIKERQNSQFSKDK